MDDAKTLQVYLANRDVPCPNCSYNLRGLSTSRCPECNLEVSLRLELEEPHLRALLVTAVGWWSSVAVPAAVVITAFGITMLPEVNSPTGSEAVLILYIPLAFAIASVPPAIYFVTVAGRRRLRSATKTKRRMMAIGGWIALLTFLVTFVTYYALVVK